MLEHGEPLTVYDLSRTYEGIPVALTTGIFARWAIWEFIERGYLTDLPGAEDIILYMGCDACTGLVRVNENLYSITGTSCYLRSLYLVSLENDYDLLKSFSNVEWPILGATKDGAFRQINNDVSVYELGLLPSYTSALNGKHLSLAKISFRY
uniref:Uncharacterized protein n=1 Tax=Aquisalinus luteolus TaxID=1566827 RepID=A0A8J3A4E9_9PROT|nr:hypothetical protein GCM10011355_34360 [Aquisalinus luteolus]